jgi:hypothetical protein
MTGHTIPPPATLTGKVTGAAATAPANRASKIKRHVQVNQNTKKELAGSLVCLDCGSVFRGTPEEIAGRGWEQHFDSDGDFSICYSCRCIREIDGVKNDSRER